MDQEMASVETVSQQRARQLWFFTWWGMAGLVAVPQVLMRWTGYLDWAEAQGQSFMLTMIAHWCMLSAAVAVTMLLRDLQR